MSCYSSSEPVCRVDLPRISTMSEPGEECVIVPGMIGVLQRQTYITPYNTMYEKPGAIIREFNHRGLRLPQKRPFLGPEVFNSGCAPLYSTNQFRPDRPSSVQNMAPATKRMYDTLWNEPFLFHGNDPPLNCACSTCDGPNSTVGWKMDREGELLWRKRME